MANENPAGASSTSEPLNSATKFFNVGSELLHEVQKHAGPSKVRSLRLTLGGRPIRDFPVSPATAIASFILIVLAVVISNLRVEVIKDMDVKADTEQGSVQTPAPGGAK